MKQCFIAVICFVLAGVSLAAPPDESSKNKNKKAQKGQTAHVASQPQPAIKGAKTHGASMRTFSPAPTQTYNAGVHPKLHTQTNVARSQANVVHPQTNVASNKTYHLQAGQKFHPRHFSVA